MLETMADLPDAPDEEAVGIGGGAAGDRCRPCASRQLGKGAHSPCLHHMDIDARWICPAKVWGAAAEGAKADVVL